METFIVPASEMINSPVIKHKDFVRYDVASQELRDAAHGINGVHGFLDGKAVIIDYKL